MTKIGKDYKLNQDKDGKVRLGVDEKAKLARLDLCTRLKRQKSKKMKWKPAR